MLNTLSFGEDMPSSGNMYLRVKQKGDKVQFRIAQNPSYIGKHFLKKEEGWDVPSCPRINQQEECLNCEEYFKLMAEAKKFADTDKKKSEEFKKSARAFQPSTTFYFPILNRETGKFAVLQTTMGVRNKLNEFHESGVDVFKKEFVLRNTGSESPRDLYSLTIVDSADTEDLTEEEEIELINAQAYDMGKISDGSSSDESFDE